MTVWEWVCSPEVSRIMGTAIALKAEGTFSNHQVRGIWAVLLGKKQWDEVLTPKEAAVLLIRGRLMDFL